MRKGCIRVKLCDGEKPLPFESGTDDNLIGQIGKDILIERVIKLRCERIQKSEQNETDQAIDNKAENTRGQFRFCMVQNPFRFHVKQNKKCDNANAAYEDDTHTARCIEIIKTIRPIGVIQALPKIRAANDDSNKASHNPE